MYSPLWHLLWSLAVSLPLDVAQSIPAAQDPQTDPFYRPPPGFERAPPGTIFRKRLVTTSFFGLVPDPVEAHQILYRTTAINGSAITSVTTVFKPLHAMTDRYVSFHTAYDSASVTCDPSYQYQLGVAQTDLISTFEFLFLQRHLLHGYIVAAPDHEGPDAALGSGRLAGMTVLDGMRAVNNFNETLGFSTSRPMIAATGYSGGAIATGWAASLHSVYAPELNVKGWAMGGTPANLTGTFYYLDGRLYSGFIPAAINGLSKPSAYGTQLLPIMDRIVTEKGQALLDYANSHCVPADLANWPNQSMLSPDIQTLGPDLLLEPTIHSVLVENLLGGRPEEAPIAPVLVYHGVEDEIIPYHDIPVMVDSWCSAGATVQFRTYTTGGHARTLLGSLTDSAGYIDDAFAGMLEHGCSWQFRTISPHPVVGKVDLGRISSQLIENLNQLFWAEAADNR
ncbi:secretory lipase-domain-containing protein [Aspergillus nidulans var. acristatus]